MAEPKAQLPTHEELTELPPRAIVAYAARCARRVQPLFAAAMPGFPNLREHCEAIDKAISLAEEWADGKSISLTAVSNACATATAAATSVSPSTGTDAATAAAKAAANAAATAREAIGESSLVERRRSVVASAAAAAANFAVTAAGFLDADIAVITEAKSDFTILKVRNFQREEACDATERGLCSKLWKGEPPRWYAEGLTRLREFGLPKKNTRSRRTTPAKSSPATEDPERKRLIEVHDRLRHNIEEMERKLTSVSKQFESAAAQVSELQKHVEELQRRAVDEVAAHQDTKTSLLKLQQDHLKLQQDKQELDGKISLIETERDLLKVQPLSWYTKLFFRPQNMFRLLTLLVLGVMVLFALLSISEVYERQALDRWVRTKADEQRDRLANGAVGNPANSATPQRRQEYDTVRSRLLVLSFAGATKPSETVGGIRDDLLREVVLQAVLTSDEETKVATKPASGKATESSWWHWLCHWLSYQSSDLLLSLVILFSGTVGAVVTTLRKDQPLTLRDLGQGLAAGFITFLVIRGGKSIFLLDADPLLLINPYNSAFMGLLAGMFTELAYELLTSVAQEIANRLKGAFDPNNGNSNRSHSSPARPPSEPPKPASDQNPARDETTSVAAASEPRQPG